jgi:hypothetical protein
MAKSRRTVPDRKTAKDERFRHKIVQRHSSHKERAVNHGLGRNRLVAETLCYMALIRDPARRTRPLLPKPLVTCSAAVRQFFRAEDGEQAAHLLPGQILIDGALPWLYLKGPAARQLENQFGYVEPLGADYNKADSAAESNGLTEAFAAACRQVLIGNGPPAADIVAAYEKVWQAGALAAFAAAEAQKRSKPAPPPLELGEYGMILNLEARSAAFSDDSIWAVHEQLSILGYYGSVMHDLPRALQPRAIAEILALPAA